MPALLQTVESYGQLSTHNNKETLVLLLPCNLVMLCGAAILGVSSHLLDVQAGYRNLTLENCCPAQTTPQHISLCMAATVNFG